VIADIDDDAGEDLVARLGSNAYYVHCDVTSEPDVKDLFRVASDLGPLGAVFANAGDVGATGPLEDTSFNDYRATMDLLCGSVFLAFKYGIMYQRPNRSGALVATASVAGLRGGLGPHLYTAAKHAVKGLVESVAVAVAPYGLTAHTVAPGGTVSSLAARVVGGDGDDLGIAHDRLARLSSSGRPTTSQDVADAAIFLSRASRINGVCLSLDGGDDLLGSAGRTYYGH